MSQVDVIVAGGEAAEQPTPRQPLASLVVALEDHTSQAGAVINLVAALIAPADGRATRHWRLEPRPAAVTAREVERGEAYSLERLAPQSPSPVLRGDAVLLTRGESMGRKRSVGHSLAHVYALGHWQRSRSRRQPPDVTLASAALATGRRRLP